MLFVARFVDIDNVVRRSTKASAAPINYKPHLQHTRQRECVNVRTQSGTHQSEFQGENASVHLCLCVVVGAVASSKYSGELQQRHIQGLYHPVHHHSSHPLGVQLVCRDSPTINKLCRFFLSSPLQRSFHPSDLLPSLPLLR